MESRNHFAHYMIKKRKEAGLTQKELADILYVSESAVSKWERGVSYPDISLIASICKALKITEHEFITASDDASSREEKRIAQKYVRQGKIITWIMNISYVGISFLALLIDVVTNHRLSYSIYVIIGCLLAFSIFNLPIYLKEPKRMKSLIVVTILIYILVFAIKLIDGGTWSLGGGLLFTTYCLFSIWLIFVFEYYIKNKLFKNSLILFMIGVVVLITNPMAHMLLEQSKFSFSNLPDYNFPIGIGLIILSIFLLLLGIFKKTKFSK